MKPIYHNSLASLFLCFLACLFVGCGVVQSNKQLTSENQEPIAYINKKNTLHWGTVNMVFPNGISAQDYQQIKKQYYTADRFTWRMSKLNRISSANSWQDAHSEAKAMVEATRNEPVNFEVAQETASSMLRSFFFSLEPTASVQEAIAYYLDILIQYQYYREPNLFANMLVKLNGYWSKEKIKEVAKRALHENTYFFENPFSTEREFVLKAQKKLHPDISAQTNSQSQQNKLATQEDIAEAERLKTEFRSNLSQIANNQYSKLKPKEWSEWVFSYTDALIILDMIAQ